MFCGFAQYLPFFIGWIVLKRMVPPYAIESMHLLRFEAETIAGFRGG
jgi:hypothetical protein